MVCREVICQFLAEIDGGGSQSELAQMLLAKCGEKDYLLRFYSRDVLFSDAARQQWAPPDLQPLG